jgi:hypothetical protein
MSKESKLTFKMSFETPRLLLTWTKESNVGSKTVAIFPRNYRGLRRKGHFFRKKVYFTGNQLNISVNLFFIKLTISF